MNRKPIAVAGLFLLVGSTPVMAQDVTAKGAPEIIKVMDLDGLTVAGKPGVEKNYKYLREPNAVVTKTGHWSSSPGRIMCEERTIAPTRMLSAGQARTAVKRGPISR